MVAMAQISPTAGSSATALDTALAELRAAHEAAGFPDLACRKDRLRRLKAVLLGKKKDFAEAIRADFGHRSRHETMVADVMTSLEAVNYADRHVGRWMRPQRRRTSMTSWPARVRVEFQPLGVVGIIAPWNYPLMLAAGPLAAALAAGNRAMIKPSEYTPHCAQLLKDSLEAAFDRTELRVVLGGADIAAAFARLPFDHLLFTGATTVGRQVMRAAAEHLVPVTLELGGKSPVIVADDAPLDQVAASVALGKLLNAGQTCIAPDYLLVSPGRRDALVAALTGWIGRLYPTLRDNPDYTSIINQRHYDRLLGLLADARDKGARVETINPGGEDFGCQSHRKMPPALILDPADNMTVMQEEIFGPLLPIVTCDTLDQAIGYVNARPRPLALYLFSQDAGVQRQVLRSTVSGGVSVNDTLRHVVQDDLPFGGVGSSGMGGYHGREGFETFSHKKAVFQQARFNLAFAARPPYGRLMNGVLKLLLR